MRTRVRGWRWRRNPLRRRSDVVEAWTVLVVVILLLVGAPLAGAFSALRAQGEARAVAAHQQAERHHVRATVTGPGADQPSTDDGGRNSYTATVRWSAPGEGTHTTTAQVPAGTRHGDTVGVWLDAQGRSVPAPAGDWAIWERTVTVGAFTSLGAALAVLLAHCAVRRTALRRRMTEWERDWAHTEPRWTRRRA